MNSAFYFLLSTSSKISLMTLGMIPSSSSFNPMVYPLPIVNVLPDPVYPYASTVALYPEKHPSTKFLTQRSKISCYLDGISKHLSKVKARSFPITN